MPSVLWRCWLGGRKGIRSVQNRVMGCWRDCLEQDADLHMAQLMPLRLTVTCFSKIQIGFTFLVPAHLGSPGKGPLNVCVCVCECFRHLSWLSGKAECWWHCWRLTVCLLYCSGDRSRSEESQPRHLQSQSPGDAGITDRFRVYAEGSAGGTTDLRYCSTVWDRPPSQCQ